MTSAILIENQTKTKALVERLRKGDFEEFDSLKHTKTGVFAVSVLEKFIEEEEIHDLKILTQNNSQTLKSMSSGERKKMLLDHLLRSNNNVLILVNPFDNLDKQTQKELKTQFENLSQEINIIQIVSRIADVLDATELFYSYQNNDLVQYDSKSDIASFSQPNFFNENAIPKPINPIQLNLTTLVEFKDVNVSFDDRQVLHNINWQIRKSDFWQLKGPNGSGKSTLLNMITGDSHKGYGQDLTLFGYKKGSGESVWDIKELVGYFTPAMVDRFRGYHTVENMLISGLHDSVGLYQKPSEVEKSQAKQWLDIVQLQSKKDNYFHQLSQGEKRLVMTARAMIKHPPLLILDEPTVGLDDYSASFFVALVNKYASESNSAVVFVSHRDERGLKPRQILELQVSAEGSKGKIHYF